MMHGTMKIKFMLRCFTSPCSMSCWYTRAPVSPLSCKNEDVTELTARPSICMMSHKCLMVFETKWHFQVKWKHFINTGRNMSSYAYSNLWELLLNITFCRWPLCFSVHYCSRDRKDVVKHFVIYLEIPSDFTVLSQRYWLDTFPITCSWCSPKGSFLGSVRWGEWASQAYQKHMMAFEIWKPSCPLPTDSVLTVVVNTHVWSSVEV